MKIQIPKVVIPVNMGEYAPELQGKDLFVWVNPPKQKIAEYNDLVTMLQTKELAAARETLLPEGAEVSKSPNGKSPLVRTFDQLSRWLKIKQETSQRADEIDQQLLDWYAEIWSQGPPDTQWTAEELRTLESQDPAFLSWMISQTWKVRAEHIEHKKKA
jgi:hypothetical protein